LLTGLLTAGCGALAPEQPPPRPDVPRATGQAAVDQVPLARMEAERRRRGPAAVLARWDRARSRAYATGDVAAGGRFILSCESNFQVAEEALVYKSSITVREERILIF
jgi:hypothetical protein